MSRSEDATRPVATDEQRPKRHRDRGEEPCAIGWVFTLDPGGNGYVRTKVRIPERVLAHCSPDASPPDLRAELVASMTREAMGEGFALEVHSEAAKRRERDDARRKETVP